MSTINDGGPAFPHDDELMGAYPAMFTMHTPSGPTNACVKHARGIETLFRFMGAHVNATKAPEGSQCDNCINEAKSEGGTQ